MGERDKMADKLHLIDLNLFLPAPQKSQPYDVFLNKFIYVLNHRHQTLNITNAAMACYSVSTVKIIVIVIMSKE